MDTKSSLLRSKIKTLLNHNGDKLGDKMATPFKQNEDKNRNKRGDNIRQKSDTKLRQS